MRDVKMKSISYERAASRRTHLRVLILLVLQFAFAANASAGLFDVSERKEIEWGKETADMIVAQFGLVDDPVQIERVEYIADAIIVVSERNDIEYYLGILDTDMVNALAIPGGYIFVTRGLIEMVNDDDELASVIAHEVVHIARKHSVVAYKKSMKNMWASLIIGLAAEDSRVMMAADMYNQSRMELFGRKAELESDRVGLQYMALAGYDPTGFLRFLDQMFISEKRRPNLLEGYFEVHPPTPERIRIVEEQVRAMGIDPTKNRGRKIRARVLSEEVCDDDESSCLGVLRGSGRELIRLADQGVFPSTYERARMAEARINSLLEQGIDIYNLRVHESGGHVTVWGDKMMIVEVLSGDVAVAGTESRTQLGEQWVSNLKQFLWSDFVNEYF